MGGWQAAVRAALGLALACKPIPARRRPSFSPAWPAPRPPCSFTEAERVLQLEIKEAGAQDMALQQLLDSEDGVIENLLFSTVADGDLAAYVHAYDRLAAWVDSSLDLYRVRRGRGGWWGQPVRREGGGQCRQVTGNAGWQECGLTSSRQAATRLRFNPVQGEAVSCQPAGPGAP